MQQTESLTKSLLCVLSYFPPDATTGTHRSRAVARYLPLHGWRPVVVCPELDAQASTDLTLLNHLPADMVIYRTPAPNVLSWSAKQRDRLKRLLGRQPTVNQSASTQSSHSANGRSTGGWMDWASWWLQVPDMMIGWLPYGLSAARQAVRCHQCRAIYSSAPQWTTHLIALLVSRRTGLPWVADFRDPWRSNPLRKIPHKALDRYDAWLERKVVQQAHWVVCNTGPMRDDFVKRFPHFASKFVTVHNGFDPEDFAGLKPQRSAGPEKQVLTHAGYFYGKRRPQPIFQALRLLRDRAAGAKNICLQLVGHPDYDGRNLNAIAADHGVSDMVLVRGEVRHRDALELMSGSDVQVLVGFNGTGADLQVPAKLFEYLGVGKPVLALAPRQSAIAEVMAAIGPLGELCDPDDPHQIADGILAMAARRPSDTAGLGGNGAGRGQSPLAHFHRREQVGRLVRLLDGTGYGPM